ncbi:hypothetical protein D779_1536 [Imhoffiella purpurea]|uniref:Uncharacterized protein n=1 Tax=Imhoffiella purpurea TaxID=1249627 RepID=W9V6P8_9GAMM|nr:hypothetical protein D779_1536 [Imhoffiella purpurea]
MIAVATVSVATMADEGSARSGCAECASRPAQPTASEGHAGRHDRIDP